jgi:hypothetical protein
MKVDDFYVQNSKDFKPPQYVEKLPPRQDIGGGEAVTIDEVIFFFFFEKKFKKTFRGINFRYINKLS